MEGDSSIQFVVFDFEGHTIYAYCIDKEIDMSCFITNQECYRYRYQDSVEVQMTSSNLVFFLIFTISSKKFSHFI